jgi:hypothetical protein
VKGLLNRIWPPPVLLEVLPPQLKQSPEGTPRFGRGLGEGKWYQRLEDSGIIPGFAGLKGVSCTATSGWGPGW